MDIDGADPIKRKRTAGSVFFWINPSPVDIQALGFLF